jgi:RNA polymerase sigma-70 factor (ECF subfamily)
MRRAKRGDRAAFGLLVERYQAALARVATSRLGDAEAADDMVQETFFAAFKSRQTYDEQYAFRTWLWTILLNQCRRHAGKLARAPRHQSLEGASDEDVDPIELAAAPTDPQPAALSLLLARERREQLDALLARLTDVQADALRLRFFGGLQFQEIAACMECSLPTAKNRVRCGLLRLSHLITEQQGNPLQPADDDARSPAGKLAAE